MVCCLAVDKWNPSWSNPTKIDIIQILDEETGSESVNAFKVTQLVNRELSFQTRSFCFLNFIYDTTNPLIFNLLSRVNVSCPLSVFIHSRNVFSWELSLYISTALSFVGKQMNSDKIWNFYFTYYVAGKTKKYNNIIYKILQIKSQHIYSEAMANRIPF